MKIVRIFFLFPASYYNCHCFNLRIATSMKPRSIIIEVYLKELGIKFILPSISRHPFFSKILLRFVENFSLIIFCIPQKLEKCIPNESFTYYLFYIILDLIVFILGDIQSVGKIFQLSVSRKFTLSFTILSRSFSKDKFYFFKYFSIPRNSTFSLNFFTR